MTSDMDQINELGNAGQRLLQVDRYLNREITYEQYCTWEPLGKLTDNRHGQINNNSRSRGEPNERRFKCCTSTVRKVN